MLIWGTGFDAMKLGNNQASQFAQLGWYGLPGGPLAAAMRIITPGRFGTEQCLNMVNSNVSGLLTQASKLFPDGHTFNTGFAGIALYVPSGEDANSQPFIGFGRTGDALICAVFKTFGQIELWRVRPGYPGATLLATSNPGSYLTDTWNYIEIGGLLANTTAGHFKVRVNTVDVISVVSTQTSPTASAANSFMIGYARDNPTGVGGQGALFDDCYVCDSTTAANNTFLGNIRARALIPAGPGSSTDWTPFGAATNWQAALNQSVDDTKYDYTGTVNDLDLYVVTPILATPQIFGVQLTGFYRQDAATQRSAANALKSGATTTQGADFFMGANYAAQTDMYEEDPNTSLPWVYTDVNLIEIGPKVTS